VEECSDSSCSFEAHFVVANVQLIKMRASNVSKQCEQAHEIFEQVMITGHIVNFASFVHQQVQSQTIIKKNDKI